MNQVTVTNHRYFKIILHGCWDGFKLKPTVRQSFCYFKWRSFYFFLRPLQKMAIELLVIFYVSWKFSFVTRWIWFLELFALPEWTLMRRLFIRRTMKDSQHWRRRFACLYWCPLRRGAFTPQDAKIKRLWHDTTHHLQFSNPSDEAKYSIPAQSIPQSSFRIFSLVLVVQEGKK